jgi:hypothetical protein
MQQALTRFPVPKKETTEKTRKRRALLGSIS